MRNCIFTKFNYLQTINFVNMNSKLAKRIQKMFHVSEIITVNEEAIIPPQYIKLGRMQRNFQSKKMN